MDQFQQPLRLHKGVIELLDHFIQLLGVLWHHALILPDLLDSAPIQPWLYCASTARLQTLACPLFLHNLTRYRIFLVAHTVGIRYDLLAD